MKVQKIVPEVCQGDNPSFEGFVVLKMPNFDEKMDVSERACDLSSGDDPKSRISAIRKMVSISKEFFVECDLKRKSDGAEFKTWAELSEGGSGTHNILIDIASQFFSAMTLGKN